VTDWPRVLLAGLALAAAAALVAAGATSGAAFAPYNPSWEGTAELRERADAAGPGDPLLRDAARYDDLEAEGTLAVVLSPETAYGTDAERLREFVRRGGTLLVAEDFGPHANPLLADLGASTRVDGRPLYDTRRYYRQPDLPVADGVADNPLVADVPSLTLNRPTAVRPGEATVLVETSEYAYVDADGDGELDDDEALGARPVATVEPVGDGRVVVLADPSVFIDRMLERQDNTVFVDGLLASHDRVVLDVSHAGALPLLQRVVFAVRDSGGLLALVGGLALGAVALLAGGRLDGRRRDPDATAPRLSAEEVRTLLARRHPDWDEAAIDRITTRLGRDRQGEGR